PRWGRGRDFAFLYAITLPRGRRFGALCVQSYRHAVVALHEARRDAAGFAGEFDVREAFHDLFPDDLELQFRQAIADAAVNAEAERQVLAGARAIYQIGVGVFDHFVVAVARDVPHHDLLALPDLLAAEFDVARRVAAHVGEWGLPADGFADHVGDEIRGFAQLLVLIGVLVEREHAARNRVAGGVVAADDEEHEVSEKFHAIHVARRGAVGEHGDEIVLRLRI